MPWLRGKVFRTVRRSLLRSQKPFFRVVEFSVQGTHVHLIVEANGRRALERGMRGLGTRVAMAINRASGRRGRVLADRYFARELRTTVHVRMALAYVLNNHRKHGRPDAAKLDPCSSGPWFTGWLGHQARAPSPLPPAQTGLLARGWRRLGLLDPREGPRYHLMWNDPSEAELVWEQDHGPPS